MARLLWTSVALSIFVAAPSPHAEVPFAEPPPPGTAQPNAALPSLSEIMLRIQLRHIRLWNAIKFENWALLNYYLEQTRNELASAALLYRNIPVDFVTAASSPLNELEAASKGRDGSKLKRAFDRFTTACNSCHRAAQVGFIIIQTPEAGPLFGDQDFRPQPAIKQGATVR
ncbi:MAG TPA: hypothetical protein VE986_02860 [Hyphomicrobiales bacterium]|nr:hypothetical protein [Hyphomicrobiales bacterium]